MQTLGTIYVTGTHIRGVDFETEHPLQVLKRDDLLRTGLTGVADVVQSLIIANGQTLNRNVNNSVHAAGKNDDLYGVVWRLRSVATLTWQHGAWGASITGRYFSPIVEPCNPPQRAAQVYQDPSWLLLCSDPEYMQDGSPAPRNRVGAVTYVDLEANWRAPWQGVLTLGVRNAFDREPPHAWSCSSFNSFFPDDDIPGRFWWLSYRQKF